MTFFASYYFGSNVPFVCNRCWRNKDDNEHNNHFIALSVFELQETVIGNERSRYPIDVEYIKAYLHVLLNCDKVKRYIG